MTGVNDDTAEHARVVETLDEVDTAECRFPVVGSEPISLEKGVYANLRRLHRYLPEWSSPEPEPVPCRGTGSRRRLADRILEPDAVNDGSSSAVDPRGTPDRGSPDREGADRRSGLASVL